jgi:DNA-binding transcriptional ArsR family regulator
MVVCLGMGNTDLRRKDTSEGRATALRASLPDPQETTRLARQAQALGDPTRLTILLLLREAGTLCVSDICLILERGQSIVSKHLKTALDAGLLSNHRLDLWMYYELTERGKELLATLLNQND